MFTSVFAYMTILFNAVISMFTGEETLVIDGLASVFDNMEYGFAHFINLFL